MSTSAKHAWFGRGVAPSLAVIAALAVCASAFAGVRGAAGAPPGDGATAKPAVPAIYVLRCWQYGKLIVEEQHLTPPDGAELKLTRLRLIDRAKRPIFLIDTANATCLIRPAAAERDPFGKD